MNAPNRFEQGNVQSLLAALAGGMDPMTGLSLWNGIQSDYQSRIESQRQAQQQKMDQLRQLAVQNAQQGLTHDASQSMMSGLYPHMSSKMSMGLDDTMANLYDPGTGLQSSQELAGYSNLAAPGSLPPTPLVASPMPGVIPDFDVEDSQDVSQTTATVVQNLQTGLGGQMPDLDTVTRQVAAHYGPQVYNAYRSTVDSIIRQAWENTTGAGQAYDDINSTMARIMAQIQQAPAAPPAPAGPDPNAVQPHNPNIPDFMQPANRAAGY